MAEAARDPSPALQTNGFPVELLAYLDYARVEKGLATNSLESYRRDLVAFVRYLRQKGREPEKANRDDVRGFLATLY